MSENGKTTSSQATFVEESVRAGHSMAAVQMWQSLCRKLAVLDEDTESFTNVVLSMSDQNGQSPLFICDLLVRNGVKKPDGAALQTLLEIAQAQDAYASPEPDEQSGSGPDEAKQATQPMTPPVEVEDSPRGTWAPKRLKRRLAMIKEEADESE